MSDINGRTALTELLPGIYLGGSGHEDELHGRSGSGSVIVLHYCREGRAGLKYSDGESVYLGPGDFCLHSAAAKHSAEPEDGKGEYSGLSIVIDLDEMAKRSPDALAGSDYIEKTLREKFCGRGSFVAQAGNEQTESIFSGFFGQSAPLQLAYQRVKALELLLYLVRLEPGNQNPLNGYQAEQVRVIRAVHDQLAAHMDTRCTIEELSRQYHMNPTTLKTLFKSVYGTSIAAHMKEHRMERAAELLRETDMSVAEIANRVGYESQSKFSAAFKECFGQLPKEYRR